ncbi:MAG: D-inositol-3-phosphate glycosyltransferase [Actinobacteria bacterium]|nr:MAG: D-inositol-3-phosphate glycosyltransferase [Actinomycetota bacterium]
MQEPYRPAAQRVPARVERVAVVSVHTCPLDQPGIGDSGGMNVYVRSVARRLAEMGVAVDIFTRAAGPEQHVVDVDPGVRVVHLEAGPDAPVDKEDLPRYVNEFLASMIRFEASEAAAAGRSSPSYDIVHSHYWLSGSIGRHARERWGVPLVQSFHTLGLVKNRTLADGESPEPHGRIAGERKVVQTADCVLAPTLGEAADLVNLYGADPRNVRVVAPGVDTDLYTPGDRETEKASLGLSGRTVVLFVGRLQPLKQPDVALRAIAELSARNPELAASLVLVVVGGPSGRGGVQPHALSKLAADLGVSHALRLEGTVPHDALPRYYRAADTVLIPSRSESFGLVAIEASACGAPVVASDVGGLRVAVRDGVTGLLVPSFAPAAYADGLARVLTDARSSEAMGSAGAHFARRFDWRRASIDLLAIYEELAGTEAHPEA